MPIRSTQGFKRIYNRVTGLVGCGKGKLYRAPRADEELNGPCRDRDSKEECCYNLEVKANRLDGREDQAMIDFGVTEKKAEALYLRMEQCGLREEDLEERFVRSTGPGGQKVNKSATCVHLKHLPTGKVLKMQKTRRQALNRFYARRRLCEFLEEAALGKASPEALKREKIRKQKDRRRRRH